MSFHFHSRFLAVTMLSAAFFSIGIGDFYSQKTTDEKLTAQQILDKHLASLGAPEVRSSIKSLTIVGTAKATFFGRGSGTSEGISVLASKADKYMVAMKFNNSDYPVEKLGFNGTDFSVGYVRPGVRSNFGSFLRTNESTFKQGLVSGVLSKYWVLLNFNTELGKLKYGGTKKVRGVKMHVLEYSPRKGSDLDVSLYFNPDTFHHVRTEYKRVIAARQGATVDASARQSETRYTMVEDFDDFRAENNMTLPHSYKISLEILTGNGTTSYEWQMLLQRFIFNQDIDDSDFKVDTY